MAEDPSAKGEAAAGQTQKTSTFSRWLGSAASGTAGFIKGVAHGVQDAGHKAASVFRSTDELEVVKGGENDEKEDWNTEQRNSLWKRLSQLIGQDIVSMISLPVWVFEPLSFLQVMAEPLQFSDLLIKANGSEDPIDRIAYLAAFNVALYSTAVRTKKPFNPILGETFELLEPNGLYRFVAEQVSHHPPIGVSQTDVKGGIRLMLETQLKSKFYGNSSEVIIPSTNHLFLKQRGEHYTWGHLITVAHNVLIGSLWQDHYGELSIVNHTGGVTCKLTYAKAGWLGSGRYQVTGTVVDSAGKVRMTLKGMWNSHLDATLVDDAGAQHGDSRRLWTAPQEQVDTKYHHAILK